MGCISAGSGSAYLGEQREMLGGEQQGEQGAGVGCRVQVQDAGCRCGVQGAGVGCRV